MQGMCLFNPTLSETGVSQAESLYEMLPEESGHQLNLQKTRLGHRLYNEWT